MPGRTGRLRERASSSVIEVIVCRDETVIPRADLASEVGDEVLAVVDRDSARELGGAGLAIADTAARASIMARREPCAAHRPAK